MAYAVMRCEKHKSGGSISGASNHCERKEKGKAKNVDESLTHLNETYNYKFGERDRKLLDVINERVEPLQKRKDSPKVIEFVLTASPDFFYKIAEKNKEKDIKKQVEKWVKKNEKFLSDTFGKKNIVRTYLHLDEKTPHLDEKTPHLHSFVVPEKDGKLNAKYYTGGRDKMRMMQTKYANYMDEFGLKRGQEKSVARHTTVREFYTRIQTENSASQRLGIDVSKLDKADIFSDKIYTKTKEPVKWKDLHRLDTSKLEREKELLERENTKLQKEIKGVDDMVKEYTSNGCESAFELLSKALKGKKERIKVQSHERKPPQQSQSMGL